MLYENYNSVDNLSDNALVNKTTRAKIRKWVAITHALVVVGPLIVYLMMTWMEESKPKRVFVARVVTLPPPPVPVIEKTKPVVKKQPKAEPKPIIKKPVIKKPKVKKPVIKKPKVKKPTKPKTKILKPEDIFKPKEVVKPKPRNVKKFDPKKFRNKLKTKNKVTPPDVKIDNSKRVANFYESVGTFLYDRWTPPSASRLGGRHPKAVVTVNINSMGRVLSWNIASSSGFISVDESIKQLMNSTRQLPAPPRGIRKFDITLRVE